MASTPVSLPLVVIVGPTASGKTELAIQIAEKYNGEIICADSRTVYAGLDIGTAKPSEAERARAPHWGLDLVEPNEIFTAADFKTYAQQKIDEIRGREHLPILVGGTGLYIDGIIFDFQFGPKSEKQQRISWQAKTVEDLIEYCHVCNIALPENTRNKRYLIRTIEQNVASASRRESPIDNTFVVGIATEKQLLRSRISIRAEHLFESGVVEEATLLGEKYGWNHEALTGNIYPLVRRYHESERTLEQIKTDFVYLDWRLAKRQMTWLRRNPHIEWCSLNEAGLYIDSKLARE